MKSGGLLVFLLSFLLYIATLAPTFLWSDSAKLAIAVAEKQFAATSFGAHPLHTILGYAFSMLPLSLAYTQNLMSAVFAAAAVFFVFKIVQFETADSIAAILASSALSVSHLFWMYAVINETYSLLAFFLATSLFCTLKYLRTNSNGYFYLVAFLFGAGFANHGMMLLFLPGILILLIQRSGIPFQKILIALGCFSLGAGPVLIFPIFQGGTLLDVFSSLHQTTQQHYETFSSGIAKLIRQVATYPLYVLYQFPGLSLLAALYGIPALKRANPRLFVGSLLIWIVTILFASLYFLQRQFPMLIPSFVVLSIWSGFGFARWRSSINKSMTLVLFLLVLLIPPILYYATYRYVEKSDALNSIRKLPYRNNARYFLFPPKQMEYGAERYVHDSFQQTKQGAIILSDFNPGMALLYGQKVLGQRKNLKIDIRIDDWIHHSQDPAAEILKYVREKMSEKQVLYLADRYEPYYHSSILQPEFELAQTGGPLWEIRKRGK